MSSVGGQVILNVDDASEAAAEFHSVENLPHRHNKRLRFSSTGSHHATNVVFQKNHVSREERGQILGRHPGFRGCTIWLTGFSGAGKTTIAFDLEDKLTSMGVPAFGVDGDNMRHGINSNLGFSHEDRKENIRRASEVSKLFAEMGVVCLASFISPYAKDRQNARRIHEEANLPFIEVFVDTPLEICEQRDTKGLYQKARAGKIKNFTGVDSVYEIPEKPDVVVQAGRFSVQECTQAILDKLLEKGILNKNILSEPADVVVDELFVDNEQELEDLLRSAGEAPKFEISTVDLQWVQVLAEGWASPLRGFMNERQYLQTLHFGQLFDGEQSINQSIPIVLALETEDKARLANCQLVCLTFQQRPLALLSNVEIFAHRKEERCARIFGTTNIGHPTVKMIMESGDWLMGGDLRVFRRIKFDDGLDRYRLTPNQIRSRCRAMNADALFAFQLRNPVHNGHAKLMSDTRLGLLRRGFKRPALLLHPLGGWTKDDDVPLIIRIEQHERVLEAGVLPADSTILAIFPSPMLYAGPTEVQWHARARLCCGVQFYIVGRDPAGIQHPDTGDYLYDPSHGSKVLAMAPGMPPNLEILPFQVAAYDKKNKMMTYFDESRSEDFEFISGTKMRQLAKSGQQPPDGFMAPEAWRVLAKFYQN